MNRPFFRADHVGSLLRPKALLDARAKFAKREIAREQLRAAEDAAIREAVRQQEEACIAQALDAFVQKLGRTDVAAIHFDRTGRRIDSSRILAAR